MRLVALGFARFFARTPWTTLTALLGVSLGVASTVAVHLISLSVAGSLEANRAPHLGGLTHLAERRGATMSDYFELRRRWRGGELPDVLGLVPMVDGRIVAGGRRFHVSGADWLALYGLPGEGRGGGAGSRPGSIVVDAGLLIAEGDRLRLGGEEWPVAGVVDSGVGDGLFADIGDALHILNAPPETLSRVGVAARDPWARLRSWLEALLPGLSAALPEGPAELRFSSGGTSGATGNANVAPADWELRPVSFEQPGARFANSILFNLGALGTLALLVAWFLIYQVSVLWVRRQSPVLESLSVLGASRRELGGCFLLAVASLGALATLVGTVAGVLLAELLSEISTAGLEAAPVPEMSSEVVAKALISGVGIAAVGGWMAFRRWGRPVSRSLFTAGRLISCALALATIAVGVGMEETGLAGGFAAILAAALLTVSLVGPLLRAARRLAVAAPGGLLTRLAVREATWFEDDVGTALGALVLAVATSVGVGLMVDSFKIDFERMLAQRLAHDFYVESPGGNLSAMTRSFAEARPQARSQAYGNLRTRIDGRIVEVGHTDFSRAEAARYGHGAALLPDEGLASESLLRALNVDIGETVDAGGAPVRIAGAFSDFGGVVPRLLMQNETAARHFGVLHFTGLGVSGISRSALEDRLAAVAPGAGVRQRDRARARALEIFDRSFAITNALTLLALTVAVVGLYNAMMGLRLNRLATRELLASLGLTAAENRHIELVRALGLGLLAVLLALPLGLAMGAILCGVINPRAFGWSVAMSLPASALALPVALGFAAAVIAAVAPSPAERVHAS
ncbi:MAG: ABC transporter permease [Gammaproteobacteria bacterium]|nr:ABC transporter permease [Gammaproteobacteria bacterium]